MCRRHLILRNCPHFHTTFLCCSIPIPKVVGRDVVHGVYCNKQRVCELRYIPPCLNAVCMVGGLPAPCERTPEKLSSIRRIQEAARSRLRRSRLSNNTKGAVSTYLPNPIAMIFVVLPFSVHCARGRARVCVCVCVCVWRLNMNMDTSSCDVRSDPPYP